jgi:hypothetical protein
LTSLEKGHLYLPEIEVDFWKYKSNINILQTCPELGMKRTWSLNVCVFCLFPRKWTKHWVRYLSLAKDNSSRWMISEDFQQTIFLTTGRTSPSVLKENHSSELGFRILYTIRQLLPCLS